MNSTALNEFYSKFHTGKQWQAFHIQNDVEQQAKYKTRHKIYIIHIYIYIYTTLYFIK